jgi:hypothetical protein
MIGIGSNGRAYSVPVSDLPGARGDGSPYTSFINLVSGTQMVSYYAGSGDDLLLIAMASGNGFLANVSDMVTRNKAGKSFVGVDEKFEGGDRVHIREAFDRLYKFCWGAKRVWSHGAGFDVIILEWYFRKIGKAIPWSFWEVRDTRTIFDLGINPNRPPVLKHHALEDAWNQAVGVQNVFKTIRSSTTFDGKLITPFANQR